MVYIITSGVYSDYGIHAVTLNKERAELLKKMYMAKGYDYVEIEEWEEDDTGDVFTPKEERTEPIEYYYVQISKTSKCRNFVQKKYRFEHKPAHGDFAITLGSLARPLVRDTNIYIAEIEAKDEEHALKVAQDMYAHALAEYYNI